MKILVLNGSPKGPHSVTLQTVKYLEILHPQHSFEILNVAQKIKSLEKDFTIAEEAVKKADLILFSYPVYTFIAPCQLHRFIELLKASPVDLTGKFAAQISTSKHFYDMTAHGYIQENIQDMGMKYISGLSADMDDLTTEKGRKEAEKFFDYLCWSMESNMYEPLVHKPSAPAHKPVSLPAPSAAEKEGDVVIITDCRPEDMQLGSMIERFQRVLPRKSRVVNIREYPFKGGCLGCFNCAVDGKCVYKDGFDDYLRDNLQKSEAMIYAFSVSDHSMGSVFKMFDDRQFCNGHRTVTMGMPVGYLISGNLSCEYNLQTILNARAQVGHNFLAGIASDEHEPDKEIDRLAHTLCYSLEQSYVPPQNFYGIGGMKIFRDLIWTMQGMMRADHKFYKSHGQYDFPQKNRGRMMAMYLVGAMLANPKIKSKMGNKMNEGMLMPYKKALSLAEKRVQKQK